MYEYHTSQSTARGAKRLFLAMALPRYEITPT